MADTLVVTRVAGADTPATSTLIVTKVVGEDAVAIAADVLVVTRVSGTDTAGSSSLLVTRVAGHDVGGTGYHKVWTGSSWEWADQPSWDGSAWR